MKAGNNLTCNQSFKKVIGKNGPGNNGPGKNGPRKKWSRKKWSRKKWSPEKMVPEKMVPAICETYAKTNYLRIQPKSTEIRLFKEQ